MKYPHCFIVETAERGGQSKVNEWWFKLNTRVSVTSVHIYGLGMIRTFGRRMNVRNDTRVVPHPDDCPCRVRASCSVGSTAYDR